MWSPNELLNTEKQRDILSYITLQFFPFKKVPLEHYPKDAGAFVVAQTPRRGYFGVRRGGAPRSELKSNDRRGRSHNNSTAISRPVVFPMGKQRRRIAPTMQYEHFSIEIPGYNVETWYIGKIFTLPGQYGSAQKFATLAGGYYPPLQRTESSAR